MVPGIKNKPSVILLPTGVNNRDGLKVLKMVAIGRIVEEAGQPALQCPPDRRSLRKAYPRCGELGAAGIKEHIERRYRGCRSP